MGRPKCYASPAARQAAYRQRLEAEMVLVNRQYLAQWDDRLTRLVDAIAQAAQAGDPLARQVHNALKETTIDHVIALFVMRGQEARRAAGAGSPTAAPALGVSEIADQTCGGCPRPVVNTTRAGSRPAADDGSP